MGTDLQQIYRTSRANVRAAFGGDEARALAYYRRYAEFVTRFAPAVPAARLLDVGCGAGWSSYLFADRGYETTGVDLNADAFEAPTSPRLRLIAASGMDLPFDDNSFDVVTAYQTLEHIPDPGRALAEMVRVCRPGGTICIVGPNLLSLAMCCRAAFVYSWMNRPIWTVFFRSPGMPRHPYGNTVFESFVSIPATCLRLAVKAVSRRANFTPRRPDMTPPFHSDNDACYVCNPVDLVKYFPAAGCEVLRVGALGRPRFTAWFAGGTWVAARTKQPLTGPGVRT